MATVRLRRHGNSVGIIFPAETRIRMGLEAGQELTLIELSDGVKLVRRSVALERQLQLAREVLREQADALQELQDQNSRT
ncbi:AbrB/MazE/SpoVT family DNA-binding domain-containing protein [Roseomonas sp. SSH11]|uniref:AbrB/MazE/SpoVT family DNA-binding domain-containing protein n=1 Tax=Pararoseomonas baculiformis TaxID=2820812 RepID=A0ABS4A819_9PROT|nr:AbrB/MazE/SpoVT family DNA-binding domain-containing protein [Pararoseomonas baculiformis]MBP0443152.1 AbrB/MazE/SpoVT family DNA-binding domain-containing protein [Pararoseomonas baculiformis]